MYDNTQFVKVKQLNKTIKEEVKVNSDTSFLLSNIQKRNGRFMEELKSPDKKGISTKRKIGKITYAPIIILYSMKIKEQSRKLAVGST